MPSLEGEGKNVATTFLNSCSLTFWQFVTINVNTFEERPFCFMTHMLNLLGNDLCLTF